MSDINTTAPAVTVDARRSALTKALGKYRSQGYAIELSGDGLQATLTRKAKLGTFWNVALSILTGGLWLIVIAIRLANRKTESVVLYVDELGKVRRS
ncbi:membrane protein [Microbacterium phage GardenState]|uniref:Membrane protein n=1 Tax=Microbacterium phage GardenState TaxID=2776841 RepID=A0A7L8ZDI5_9CAUD|nr:membrane protein [Microbacterium phage GardenState]